MLAIPRIKDICVLSFIGLIAAADMAPGPVFAQETFPSRPMKVSRPWRPGQHRTLRCDFLRIAVASLRVPVIVENQPAAGGVTAPAPSSMLRMTVYDRVVRQQHCDQC